MLHVDLSDVYFQVPFLSWTCWFGQGRKPYVCSSPTCIEAHMNWVGDQAWKLYLSENSNIVIIYRTNSSISCVIWTCEEVVEGLSRWRWTSIQNQYTWNFCAIFRWEVSYSLLFVKRRWTAAGFVFLVQCSILPDYLFFMRFGAIYNNSWGLLYVL